MYRGLPSGNKILSKKWQEKERRIHLKKLRNVKPTIDIRRPKHFKHLKSRAKKEQMLEDRYTEIERENRILLEKMTSNHIKPLYLLILIFSLQVLCKSLIEHRLLSALIDLVPQ